MRAILMFHGVDDSGSVLSISAEEFESLLRSVVESGHHIAPLRSLLETPDQNQVALTFDDGFKSVLTHAAPVLQRLGHEATLFLTTGYVGKDNRWPTQPADAPTMPMMDWNDLLALKKRGWSIEAHSVSHPDLRKLTADQLAEELEQPIETIHQRLGNQSRVLAYPYGYFDRRVRQAAEQHYEYGLSTNFTTLEAKHDRFSVPRLDSYYFRSQKIHRHFSGGLPFRGYLRLRRLARRLRAHPGEITT